MSDKPDKQLDDIVADLRAQAALYESVTFNSQPLAYLAERIEDAAERGRVEVPVRWCTVHNAILSPYFDGHFNGHVEASVELKTAPTGAWGQPCQLVPLYRYPTEEP